MINEKNSNFSASTSLNLIASPVKGKNHWVFLALHYIVCQTCVHSNEKNVKNKLFTLHIIMFCIQPNFTKISSDMAITCTCVSAVSSIYDSCTQMYMSVCFLFFSV